MLHLQFNLAVFIFFKKVQFQSNVSHHPLLEDVDEMLILISDERVI